MGRVFILKSLSKCSRGMNCSRSMNFTRGLAIPAILVYYHICHEYRFFFL